MTPHAYRQRVTEAIVSALNMQQDVAGCWEGGAAAIGRIDKFSDIDIVVVAPLDAADTIFAAIETAISAINAMKFRIDGTSIRRPSATRRSAFTSWPAHRAFSRSIA